MKKTRYLRLNKPELHDGFCVEHQNGNWDKLDAECHRINLWMWAVVLCGALCSIRKLIQRHGALLKNIQKQFVLYCRR